MDGGVLAGRFLEGEGAAGRDFGGTRFRSSMPVATRKGCSRRDGPRQNVSDQPGKVLIQPESLILAQSERWRQA